MTQPMVDYATAADLAFHGCPRSVIDAAEAREPGITAAQLTTQSRIVDGYARPKRYIVPFTTVPDEVKNVVCKLVAYELLRVRGVDSNADANELARLAAKSATDWLKDLSKGSVQLDSPTENGPIASSGKPDAPTCFDEKFQNDWADF